MRRAHNYWICSGCRSGRKDKRWQRKALLYAKNDANIRLEFGIDVESAAGRVVIYGVLDFVVFVFVNWRLKARFQVSSNLPGR